MLMQAILALASFFFKFPATVEATFFDGCLKKVFKSCVVLTLDVVVKAGKGWATEENKETA